MMFYPQTVEAAEKAILAVYPGAEVVSVLERIPGVTVSADELLGYLNQVKCCSTYSFTAFMEACEVLDGVMQFLVSAGFMENSQWDALYESDRRAGYNLPHLV